MFEQDRLPSKREFQAIIHDVLCGLQALNDCSSIFRANFAYVTRDREGRVGAFLVPNFFGLAMHTAKDRDSSDREFCIAMERSEVSSRHFLNMSHCALAIRNILAGQGLLSPQNDTSFIEEAKLFWPELNNFLAACSYAKEDYETLIRLWDAIPLETFVRFPDDSKL
jgi:hypothetical protein